jgi:hypothetical protein
MSSVAMPSTNNFERHGCGVLPVAAAAAASHVQYASFTAPSGAWQKLDVGRVSSHASGGGLPPNGFKDMPAVAVAVVLLMLAVALLVVAVAVVLLMLAVALLTVAVEGQVPSLVRPHGA